MHSNESMLCNAGLMNAVMAVSWPISQEYSEESSYNTLLQISVGQEEVDEVIGRDINRTFPEHPQFGFEQGQQALYRVLKAYSLHDLEVESQHHRAFLGHDQSYIKCTGPSKFVHNLKVSSYKGKCILSQSKETDLQDAQQSELSFQFETRHRH